MKEALTFDDVTIVPRYTEVESRANCDTSTRLSKNYTLSNPIISANMDTVTEVDMAFEQWRLGGMGFIHRFGPIEWQAKQTSDLYFKIRDELHKQNKNYTDENNLRIGGTIGVSGDYLERAQELYNEGATVFLIDIANGHSLLMRNAIANLRLKFGDDVDIIAGNICTGKAALDLMDWGADAVKVGIGGGCFTPEMQVNTSAGLKNISDVEIGDQVYTHTGVLKSVIDKLTFEKDEDLIEINGIQCTQNHEFYVLHRRYSEKLDDPLFDLNQHAEWISAGNLTVDYLLLERQDTEEISFKAIKIDYIKQFHYIGTVYDLTVQDDHSYNINNIIVHNSVCETRIRTGIGIPQFTAIQQCVEALNTRKNPIPIISDGGIRTPADVCKAIAAGASSVMIGSLFAATAETPGSIKKTGKWPNEQLFKEYRGSASRSSKLDRGEAGKNVEGAETLISYRGKVERIVNDILDGLRSSMSYLGAKNIFEMQANAEFMRITGAGLIEAHPHALIK